MNDNHRKDYKSTLMISAHVAAMKKEQTKQISYTETEVGVMVMKNGKAWGLLYDDGRSTSYGWVDPTCAEISDPRFCTKPTDVTYSGSPYEIELSDAEVLKVEREVTVTVINVV